MLDIKFVRENPEIYDYTLEEICAAVHEKGGLVVQARVTEIVPEGVLFMPFHFADGPANMLTNTALDPTAKIPELKVCAARIEKA